MSIKKDGYAFLIDIYCNILLKLIDKLEYVMLKFTGKFLRFAL